MIDHGHNDALDFDLSGFGPVVLGIRSSLIDQGLLRESCGKPSPSVRERTAAACAWDGKAASTEGDCGLLRPSFGSAESP